MGVESVGLSPHILVVKACFVCLEKHLHTRFLPPPLSLDYQHSRRRGQFSTEVFFICCTRLSFGLSSPPKITENTFSVV